MTAQTTQPVTAQPAACPGCGDTAPSHPKDCKQRPALLPEPGLWLAAEMTTGDISVLRDVLCAGWAMREAVSDSAWRDGVWQDVADLLDDLHLAATAVYRCADEARIAPGDPCALQILWPDGALPPLGQPQSHREQFPSAEARDQAAAHYRAHGAAVANVTTCMEPAA